MTTKIDRINSAYSQIRISGLTVNPSPEDVTVALSRLETMIAELERGRNICMGYNFELEPDPNSVTNVPIEYWHAIDTNLAIRLIPDFNKDVPQVLIAQASQSLATASSMSAADNIRQIRPSDRMPLGSGTTQRYNRYQRFNRTQSLPPADCETNAIVLDGINDYQESFRAYLDASETIASYEIVVDPGLILESDSNNDPLISYRIKASESATNGTWQQVKITITTSSGRVEQRFINFELQSNVTVNNKK